MISDRAREETASLDPADERLDERAAILLSSLGNRPNLSIPGLRRTRGDAGRVPVLRQ